jgi:phytoene desaturase
MTDDTVIVIGAGVAGLAAGAYLAHQGMQVMVMEAASMAGGSSADVTIEGYVFNQGAQYLILPQMLDSVFAQLGANREQELPLVPVETPQSITFLDGSRIRIGPGYQTETSISDLDIKASEGELHQMASRWRPILGVFLDEDLLSKPFSYFNYLRKAWRQLPKFGHSLQKELISSFHNTHFRKAVAGLLLFSGALPRDLSAPSLAALVAILDDGMYLPAGGMGRRPAALTHVLKQYGGELNLESRVQGILSSGGHVQGVEVNGREPIPATYVISTVSALVTYSDLIEAEMLPQRIRRKVHRTPRSIKAFSLQVGLRNQIKVDSHLNYFLPAKMDNYFNDSGLDVHSGYFNVPTLVQPDLAPPGGSIVEFYRALPADEPSSIWNEERKHAAAEAALEWLSERLDMQVGLRRVRTPLDFETELGLPGGSIYGISAAAGPLALFPHRGPLVGLYQAGQSTFPGFGVPTAALSGIYAAKRLHSDLETKAWR